MILLAKVTQSYYEMVLVVGCSHSVHKTPKHTNITLMRIVLKYTGSTDDFYEEYLHSE